MVSRSSRIRSVLIIIACAYVSMIVWMFALEALFARQEGLGVAASAAKAWHQLARKLPPVVLGCGIGLAIVIVLLRQRATGAGTPVEAGKTMWRRTQLFTAIGMAPFLLIAAAMMIYHLATNQWQDLDWILAALFVLFGAVLVGQLLHRPDAERLYVLGTGDDSRVNDERAQTVKGRAAQTTLSFFAAFLILGGLPYEMLVLGVWPILTGSAVVVLVSILAIATSYWNRRI